MPVFLPMCPGTGSSPGHSGVRFRQIFAVNDMLQEETQPFFEPWINLFYCHVKEKQKSGAIMLMGAPPTPPQHSPPGLCQDDSAPTIPLIISTCVDSPLEATLPPNLHYWNPKGLRQVERSSLSEMDCGLPGPSAIPHKPSSHFPLLSAHPSQHACPVVDGICRSSCLALFLWASLFLHPWPCLSTCLGKERY